MNVIHREIWVLMFIRLLCFSFFHPFLDFTFRGRARACSVRKSERSIRNLLFLSRCCLICTKSCQENCSKREQQNCVNHKFYIFLFLFSYLQDINFHLFRFYLLFFSVSSPLIRSFCFLFGHSYLFLNGFLIVGQAKCIKKVVQYTAIFYNVAQNTIFSFKQFCAYYFERNWMK